MNIGRRAPHRPARVGASAPGARGDHVGRAEAVGRRASLGRHPAASPMPTALAHLVLPGQGRRPHDSHAPHALPERIRAAAGCAPRPAGPRSRLGGSRRVDHGRSPVHLRVAALTPDRSAGHMAMPRTTTVRRLPARPSGDDRDGAIAASRRPVQPHPSPPGARARAADEPRWTARPCAARRMLARSRHGTAGRCVCAPSTHTTPARVGRGAHYLALGRSPPRPPP
jgi:hypothetical protein